MKILKFFAKKEIVIEGVTVRFKAASEQSQEHAEELLKKKEERYRNCLEGRDRGRKTPPDAEYEAPIAEEICETLDEHNIVTRNRYGARVLNTDELLFLDIDYVPPRFGEWFA